MPREIQIDSTVINDESDCYVIAEIGHNHQGNVDIAKQLFVAAKEAGANAVKLQKRDNRNLYTPALYDSPYLNRNSYGNTYGEHREALEFGFAEFCELNAFARELQMTMFSTAFDIMSAELLARLDVPAYKIASGDLKNTVLLKFIAQLQKPVLLSTGGGTLDDVKRAYDCLVSINSNVCLMQCTANYPVEPVDMNLRVIRTYRREFPQVVIGLSDHQSGIAMAPIGYVLGARIIEKHFTLNRAWKGSDHAFSLEPGGLKKMIRDLRRARVALGDGIKRVMPGENQALFKMGKKIVAARDLPAGKELSIDDVMFKSPNDGLPPSAINEVVGLKLKRSVKRDEDIVFDVLVR